MSTTWVVSLVASLAAVCCVIRWQSKKRSVDKILLSSQSGNRCKRRIRLMDLESSRIMMNIFAVTTITFYEGTLHANRLKKRVEEIVAANPWLESNIVEADGNIEIVFEETPIQHSFQQCERTLPEISDYDSLVESISEFTVKPSSKCLNTTQPLFLVTAIQTSPDTFAIVFSISHQLVDGSSYYRLYAMLDESVPVESLNAERIHGFRELCGKECLSEFRSWIRSIGTTLNLMTVKVFSPLPTMKTFEINLEEVNRRKKEFRKQQQVETGTDVTGFISTNDIVTSEFFKCSQCDVGLMTINTRGRITSLDQNLAGNYESAIIFQKDDFSNPFFVRKALPQFRRVASGPLPMGLQAFRSRLGLVSSWSTLHQEVVLPGAQQTLHLPVVKRERFGFHTSAVIYKPTKDRLALLVFYRGDFNSKKSMLFP